jgi:hypothetical protein
VDGNLEGRLNNSSGAMVLGNITPGATLGATSEEAFVKLVGSAEVVGLSPIKSKRSSIETMSSMIGGEEGAPSYMAETRDDEEGFEGIV